MASKLWFFLNDKKHFYPREINSRGVIFWTICFNIFGWAGCDSCRVCPALRIRIKNNFQLCINRRFESIVRIFIRFFVSYLDPSFLAQCWIRLEQKYCPHYWHSKQSWARDNSVATMCPCYQATKLLVIAILLLFIATTPSRHSGLTIFRFFLVPNWSLRLYYVVALSLSLS